MAFMIKMVHIWGSYLFLLTFLIAFSLGVYSLVRKRADIQNLSAWGFVASFVCLAVAYACGFPSEAALAHHLPEVIKLASRHHDLAKFALTGMMLNAAASLTVIYKYRGQRFPAWFLPNLLFLSLMIVSFSFLSMTYIWKFANHPQRNTIAAPQDADPFGKIKPPSASGSNPH